MEYFKRHWEGKNSLPFAYWVNFFAVGWFRDMFAVLLISLMASIGDEDRNPLNMPIPMAIIIIVAFGFIVWQVVGTWRSATNYSQQARTDKTKRPFWAILTKVLVALSMIINGIIFGGLLIIALMTLMID